MPQAKTDDDVRAEALAIRTLLRPEAFPHETGRIELRETHISWIVLTGSYAYKIKKPVRFDFIDASTLERRRHYCEEELRLNRRLAHDLYLEVVPITRTSAGPVVGGEGPAIEYAVRMRQFSASDELPALLAKNDVSVAEIGALGASLGRFHQGAAVAPASQAPERTEQMYDAVLGNLAQLLTHIGSIEPSLGLSRLIDWTHDSARQLEQLLKERERSGFVREGHGDLHAANIVRSQGLLVPFDCIEFEPSLRWIDVMSDVAFLVMDLVSHQRADFAFLLLSRYLEVTGDYEGLTVLPFYAAYRALVRAKVDALTAEEVPDRAAEFRHRLGRRIRAAVSWTTRRVHRRSSSCTVHPARVSRGSAIASSPSYVPCAYARTSSASAWRASNPRNRLPLAYARASTRRSSAIARMPTWLTARKTACAPGSVRLSMRRFSSRATERCSVASHRAWNCRVSSSRARPTRSRSQPVSANARPAAAMRLTQTCPSLTISCAKFNLSSRTNGPA